LKNPIKFFVGILDIISEFAKILSFSFRLFGNIFAGEVLISVMVFLIPVLVPVPFLILEVFIGFIQALVFTMLSTIFIVVATEAHQE
jgi:F-type H+-transporting ATPase subunit a